MAVDVHLRGASQDDIPFLWRMLTFAASMHGTAEDIERAHTDPALKDYVEGFGRAGDVGVIALVEGERVGAAWVRLAPPGRPVSESKVWSADVPELAIATVPELRGSGVGTTLLHGLFDALRGQHASLALSVREENSAVRLYERAGFHVQRRIVNRVGSTSLVMSRNV